MTDMDALFDGGNAHLLPGGPAHTVALLKHFNAWRRGDERLEMPNPAEIGLAIDSAIELIERHHAVIKTISAAIDNADEVVGTDDFMAMELQMDDYHTIASAIAMATGCEP